MRFAHNSTILRKQKDCVICGKPCYPFSKGRCQRCATTENTMKRMEELNNQAVDKEDLSSLIQDADAIFSQYIRLKYAYKDGTVKCYTCPHRNKWTKLQNGHYVRRGHLLLRFDERNCRPQCETCNQFKHGNLKVYADNLEKEKPGITDILFEESVLVHRPSRDEVRQIIAEYTPKVKLLNQKIESWTKK